MAPPQVPATEVYFYTEEGYAGGKPRAYKVGEEENLSPAGVGEKYRSVAVGSDVRVLGWQRSSAGGSGSSEDTTSSDSAATTSGAYAELTSSAPALRGPITALSRFRVLDDDTRVLAFKFVDATVGGAAGAKLRGYSLKVEAPEIGERILYSNETDDGTGTSTDESSSGEQGDQGDGGDSSTGGFRLVGTIAEGGPDVTSAVYVRNETTGAYVAVGSARFRWNAQAGRVDLDDANANADSGFPRQLRAERAAPNKWVVTLVSGEPEA